MSTDRRPRHNPQEEASSRPESAEAPLRVNAVLERGSIRLSHLGKDWILHRPADLESLWDAISDEEFAEDERLPYWVELWPSSLALAAWLERRKNLVKGSLCLDLGCGLGFTALAAARMGARVMGMDYELEALTYARMNAEANDVPSPRWLLMDWRRPALAAQSCDCIWGGDVLYEKRFASPVFAFLDHVLAPDGVVWLAEPGRNTYQDFMLVLARKGWKGKCAHKEQVEALHVQKTPVSVNIWEIRR